MFPAIFQIRQLISPSEAQALIDYASPLMKNSTVRAMDTADVTVKLDLSGRQSNDFRPQRNSTQLVAKFEQRTSDLVRIPHDHIELLQVLEYRPGQ